jgi:uncharacterized protein (TIGR03435 family)
MTGMQLRIGICCAVLSCLLGAQQSAQNKFEVASVKKSKSGATNYSFHSTADGFATENMPLDMIICQAYHIKKYQLIGGPKWIQDFGYDINAKADRKISNEERMQMVQALLMDRFHLKLNRVSRQASLYAMVVSKGGPLLKPSNCGAGEKESCGGYSWGGNDVAGSGIELAQLAGALTDSLDLPVIDKTGLNGRFDIKLHWASTDNTGADAAGGSIFTAIQEQLGLKLRLQKGPVEMLSIEHVERPDEN